MATHCVRQTVEALTEKLRRIERRRRVGIGRVISSGHAALDRFLPEGGFRRGTLVEWLAGGQGSGAGVLALMAAREAAASGGALVVVDPESRFYPPAAAGLGIELARLIVVRPACNADGAWAVDQILRSPGVAALWHWPSEPDEHTQRRWQLAAESSGVFGFFLRPETARHEPSWAELRLRVEPLATPTGTSRDRRLRVELLRNRGGRAGGTVELEIATDDQLPHTGPSPASGEKRGKSHVAFAHHSTGPVHLASAVASAKTHRRSRRA